MHLDKARQPHSVGLSDLVADARHVPGVDLHRQLQITRHAHEGMEEVIVQRLYPIRIGRRASGVRHEPVEDGLRLRAGGVVVLQGARVGGLVLERHGPKRLVPFEDLPTGLQIFVQ